MKARIAFADEAGFSDRPMVRKTWAPKGQTPILKIPGRWKMRSAIGMIACSPNGERPKLLFRTLPKAMDGNLFLAFLKDVKRWAKSIRVRKRKLILIVDNLRAHKTPDVRAYVRSQQSWLEVPAYAPELNPVEYLWSSRKRKRFPNAEIKTKEDLDRRIRAAGREAQRNPELLRGFLKKSSLFDAYL